MTDGKKPKKTEHLFFGRWLMNVGEAPVLYDSAVVANSAKQVRLFLNTKGYFYNTVKDTAYLKRKRAEVVFKAVLGKPYKVRAVSYDIEDKQIDGFVKKDTANCLILKGKNYDAEIIIKERERLTRMLNNNGYWGFSKEFIYFKVDSSLKSNQLDIAIGIKNQSVPVAGYPDSLIEAPHRRYFISDITIDTEFDNTLKTQNQKDTLKINNYAILYNNTLKFRPAILMEALFINRKGMYQIKNSEDTYKRLSELKAFRFVRIDYKVKPGTEDSLNCTIDLNPVLKNSFSVETEGTNTGGNLGVSGSIIFQNKNVFHGGEVFEVKLTGGLEIQRLLQQQGGNSNISLKTGIPFNTLEFGPEVNLYVPKFLVPFKLFESKTSNPKTIFTFTTNYQQQPDYTRLINKISYGYTWKRNKFITNQLNPIEVSFVKANLTDTSFNRIIETNPDILIRNAYESHLVTDTRYSFVYNDQIFGTSRNHQYFKFDVESSGNILRGAFNLIKAKKDTNGSYDILNVPFSQYLRADADYRFYDKVADHQYLVFRGFAGAGLTLANLQGLPFEKSFYGGGADDIRAWVIRSLGPGNYNGVSNFDQIGDMQLEANAEYRVKLFKQLNGAVFVDAGNVWLMNKQGQDQPDLQGQFFQLNQFYKQVAIGTGIGARFDFSFFIIRLDLGIKVYDPYFESMSTKDCWVVDHWFDPSWKSWFNTKYGSSYAFTNLNLGIGYPF